jgi:flagellar motor switch protein FliG
MGVYTRFKREPEGFRALVELLETTPVERRRRMLEVGMQEDPEFTRDAERYLFTFEDILQLPDMELAELAATAPPRITAYSLYGCSQEVILRFLRNSKPRVMAEVRDLMEVKIGPVECGGARLKLIGVARQLEKRGKILTKKIPLRGVQR